MEQLILEAIDYVRNVNKKRLSIANILSRISKTSASNLETRSLVKELHQMIAKRFIDSSYQVHLFFISITTISILRLKFLKNLSML